MKPILFNTEMVRAILAGRKTVTRRVVKPQPTWFDCGNGMQDVPMQDVFVAKNNPIEPPYQKGDILYVRETWAHDDYEGFVDYRANFTDEEANGIKWKPSIHMPKNAARIFLRVTSVRVERLQKMNGNDLEREGIKTGITHFKSQFNNISADEFEAKWIPWDDGWFYGVMCSGCLRQYQGDAPGDKCLNCGRGMFNDQSE